VAGVDGPATDEVIAMAFRSIESAPRDGRNILVSDALGRLRIAFWSTVLEEHWQPVEQPWTDFQATAWAPLPEACGT
jgi:hypothetical protein